MADMRWLTQGEDTSDWDRRIEGYYPKIEDDDDSFTSDEFEDYWD